MDYGAASTSGRQADLTAAVVLGLVATVWVLLVALLPRTSDWAVDLDAYLRAADRLLAGEPLYKARTTSGPFSPGPTGLYLYAPPFAVAMTPLALLGDVLATRLWLVLHAAALAAACALMPIRPGLRVAAPSARRRSPPFGTACWAM